MHADAAPASSASIRRRCLPKETPSQNCSNAPDNCAKKKRMSQIYTARNTRRATAPKKKKNEPDVYGIRQMYKAYVVLVVMNEDLLAKLVADNMYT